MQIQFDPRDRNACSAVLAAIFVSHPDLQDFGHPAPATPERFESADQADASEAFGGAADPATAFSPSPASDGPTDASTGTLASSAPAGTPVAGTSDNGNGQAAPPTASPSSAPPAGVELDAKGLPWDGRIHAGTAAKPIKVGDGSWRKRRGVDDATVATVEAELRQVMAAPGPNATPAAPTAAASPEPAPAPAPTAAPAAPPPTPEPAAMASGPDVATTAPSAPPPAPPVAAPPVAAAPLPPVAAATPVEPAPAPAATPTPPPAAPTGPVTALPELMRKITALQTAGTLDVAGTNAIAVSLGLTSVRDLVQRPDLVASFDALLPVAA